MDDLAVVDSCLAVDMVERDIDNYDILSNITPQPEPGMLLLWSVCGHFKLLCIVLHYNDAIFVSIGFPVPRIKK